MCPNKCPIFISRTFDVVTARDEDGILSLSDTIESLLATQHSRSERKKGDAKGEISAR